MTQEIRIGKAELFAFVREVFVAAGVAPGHSEEWAQVLVWANLRGVDSHGIIRIPRYLDLLKRKAINGNPAMRVERKSGAVVVLEADRAPGPVAMMRAMQEAMARAREVHIGWCGARNITHAGAIGYFALQAAQAGMAGIAMSASGPMMAYPGTRGAAVSSNPLAIAVPAKGRRPFLIDLSTATVANGKIMAARDKGEPVPLGWGIDAEGRDTSDPRAIATLLPMGGAKGAGLSFMIECLCSIALSNPRVAPDLEADADNDDPYLNGAAIAIDLAAFGDREAFLSEATRLGNAIAGLPRAPGVERILLPGERGDRTMAEREASGIPIPAGTWQRVIKAAESVGVKAPLQNVMT